MKQRTALSNKKNSNYKNKLKKKYKNNYFFKIAKKIKTILVFIAWRIKVNFRKQKALFNFDRIYWVKPEKITYCTLKEFNPFQYDGLTLGGDWDVSNKKFEDLDIFTAFENHILIGLDWKKTEFYKNTIKNISKNNFPWKCYSEKDFIERCQSLDVLYTKISTQGYQPQSKNIEGFKGINIIDEISVNLDRNGELLFNNGAHRLAIAKILKIKAIPIRLTVCHKNCKNFNILKEYDPF